MRRVLLTPLLSEENCDSEKTKSLSRSQWADIRIPSWFVKPQAAGALSPSPEFQIQQVCDRVGGGAFHKGSWVLLLLQGLHFETHCSEPLGSVAGQECTPGLGVLLGPLKWRLVLTAQGGGTKGFLVGGSVGGSFFLGAILACSGVKGKGRVDAGAEREGFARIESQFIMTSTSRLSAGSWQF